MCTVAAALWWAPVPPSALPIDELIEPIVSALETRAALVIEAPPGAGKTPRIPRALLEAGHGERGEIWVAEPRRVAARLAASYVAGELGEPVGERVGYSVRFDEAHGPRTRVRYVTEGVLQKRLMDPGAPPLAVVVLDEFHERHLATDLNLILCKRRLADDPRFRLIVMSATLDAAGVARYLGDCPRLTSEGRMFPLSLEHESAPDDRPVDKRALSALKTLLREPGGDVLVFLPGTAEIRALQAGLEPSARELGVDVLPLYGEMALAEQARAVQKGARRRVVLATNVAESSITVQGVTIVVDSGLARVAEHSPWTGRQGLVIREVSQASATQRAGRAGRTAPGRVVRLYSEQNFKARPRQDVPEVQRLDLSEALLTLAGAGVAPDAIEWLDAPPPALVSGARGLLGKLGFIDDGARITALGREALRLPLPPRLARVVLEGERLGIADEACLAAALLGERDIRSRASAQHGGMLGVDCDVSQLSEYYRQAEEQRFSASSLRELGLERERAQAVRNAYRQLRQELGALRRARGRAAPGDVDPPEGALGLALLAGYPDRVARRRRAGGQELILATGHNARLARESVVQSPPLLLAVGAEEQSGAAGARGGAVARAVFVRLATPLAAEWLFDHHMDQIESRDELEWDAERECVEVVSQLCWGAVVLEESRRKATPGDATAALVERAALAQQANLFGKRDTLELLFARAELLAQHLPELGLAQHAQGGPEALLSAACREVVSLAELRALDWSALFNSRLGPAELAALAREVPEQVTLMRGRKVRVHYERGQAPWIESRLQDFFGMQAAPRILAGRLPLTLHLLAPNQRAVQVTTDLAGFWERHYPAIRRELHRKYPRHAWPEDGRSASPEERPKR
jgi:ATP-dependent helicase HrpB